MTSTLSQNRSLLVVRLAVDPIVVGSTGHYLFILSAIVDRNRAFVDAKRAFGNIVVGKTLTIGSLEIYLLSRTLSSTGY